ncbi:Uu.00g083870.m01.CDS01 [Anthostomella pinea]|uniref:Uu.00g083870.m01.CDS01 n=1 Tax=Anthostomella pinea TaxID=933095 RepID=A0AAI8YJI9_9PEZI|nr:Uu.00g083870.m01.CDS01 [Anthostomella pinea]
MAIADHEIGYLVRLTKTNSVKQVKSYLKALAKREDTTICEILAETATDDGKTILYHAILAEATGKPGPSPQNMSIQKGGREASKAVRQHGAAHDIMPLHVAARRGLLATYDALVEAAVDDQGQNVLHFAATSGNKSLVSSILGTWAGDINSSTNDKETALHMAAGNNNVDIVRLLLEKGINYKSKDVYRNTAKGAAMLNSADDVFRFFEESKIYDYGEEEDDDDDEGDDDDEDEEMEDEDEDE